MAVWQYARPEDRRIRDGGEGESDEDSEDSGLPLYQPQLDYSTRLTSAIANGESLRTIIRLSSHPQCKDLRNPSPVNGYTNLMLAASLGRLDYFQTLLERGHESKEMSRDSQRNTCLHVCARLGEIPILQYYASFFPALLDWTNSTGMTPLAVACAAGQARVVQMLLELGSEINHPDADGNTPLHYASSHGQERIIKILFRKGLALNYPEGEGQGEGIDKETLLISPPDPEPDRKVADLFPSSTGHLQFAAKNSLGFSPIDYAYKFQIAALIKQLGRELLQAHPEIESDLWGSAAVYELGGTKGQKPVTPRSPKTPLAGGNRTTATGTGRSPKFASPNATARSPGPDSPGLLSPHREWIEGHTWERREDLDGRDTPSPEPDSARGVVSAGLPPDTRRDNPLPLTPISVHGPEQDYLDVGGEDRAKGPSARPSFGTHLEALSSTSSHDSGSREGQGARLETHSQSQSGSGSGVARNDGPASQLSTEAYLGFADEGTGRARRTSRRESSGGPLRWFKRG